MAELCDSRRFVIVPSIAYYMPVEKMLRAAEGDLPRKNLDIAGRLLVPLSEQLAIEAACADPAGGCDLIDTRIDINVDGVAKLCCASYDRGSNVAADFLAVPFEDLQARRARADLRRPCLGREIDCIYTVEDNRLQQKSEKRTLKAAKSPQCFQSGGYVIEGVEAEASLLAAAVNRMNAGDLQAAANLKHRLDRLLVAKYGYHCASSDTPARGFYAGAGAAASRFRAIGCSIFLLAASWCATWIMTRPRRARCSSCSPPLANAPETDVAYRGQVAILRPIIGQWCALPY